jgi:hypothetical protein
MLEQLETRNLFSVSGLIQPLSATSMLPGLINQTSGPKPLISPFIIPAGLNGYMAPNLQTGYSFSQIGFLQGFPARTTLNVSGGIDGLNSTNIYPPDTNLAVGPSHVVETVNETMATYNKSTRAQVASEDLTTLFNGLPNTGDIGPFDPSVMYDDSAGRFVIEAVIRDGTNSKCFVDFAVSNTSDPTQGWTTFAIEVDQSGKYWSDNGKIGFNNDAIVYTGNLYTFSNSFFGEDIVTIATSSVGGSLTDNVIIQPGVFSLIPARMHASTAGGPMWFVMSDNNGATSIDVVRMDNVLGSPTFTTTALSVNGYGRPTSNIPQLGGSISVAKVDSRVLNVEWYNNNLVASLNSSIGSDAAAAWFEFNTAGVSPGLTQQGVIHPATGVSTYEPAVGVDAKGDIGLTYMESSASEFVSMYLAGRRPSDPAGAMPATMLAAAGSTPLFASDRVGDYAGISLDPSAPNSFWAANEYSPVDAPIFPLYGTFLAPFQISQSSYWAAGRGQTIAIVDAFDSPYLGPFGVNGGGVLDSRDPFYRTSDLATFSAANGLPQLDGKGGDPTFTKLDQFGNPIITLPNGNPPPNAPFPDVGWSEEIALDVEWAHAITPSANIVLVEASFPDSADLYKAVRTASNLPGVHVVSMSWGTDEINLTPATVASLDMNFKQPSAPRGVTFVASSGDDGGIYGPSYPAVSPYVLSVGGTGLYLNANSTYKSETAWNLSNGGYSVIEPEPGYQFSAQQSGVRSVPDVGYLADLSAEGPGHSPGVAELDTLLVLVGAPAWIEQGGTSAGAPQWSALVSIVNQGRTLRGLPALDGYKDLLPGLYNIYATSPFTLLGNPSKNNLYAQDFHQVTIGHNNYYSATAGYNLVTGLGTPNAGNLVAGLVSLLPGSSSGGAGGGGGIFGSGGPPLPFALHPAIAGLSAPARTMAALQAAVAPATESATLRSLPLPVFNVSSAPPFSPRPVAPASLDTQLSTRSQASQSLAFVDAGGTLSEVEEETVPEQAPEQTSRNWISPWASPPEDAAPLQPFTDWASTSESSERAREATVSAHSSPSAVDAFFGIVGSLDVLEATPPAAPGASDDASVLEPAQPLGIALALAGGLSGSPSRQISSFFESFPRKRGHLDRPT